MPSGDAHGGREVGNRDASQPWLAKLILLLGVSSSAGCPDPGPEPGEDCIAQRPAAELSSLPTRVVELGSGTGADFRAWTEGASVPVTVGGQGFSMLTPSLRLAADGEGMSDACYWVNLEPVTADGETSADGIGWFEGGLVFSPGSDGLTAGPIFSPLENDTPGQAVYYRVTVASEDFVAQQMLGVVTGG